MEGQEFVTVGGADGPQLNTDALKAAAHNFLNKGTASPSGEQPQTSTRSEPVSPVQQIPVISTPLVAAETSVAAPVSEEAPASEKVTTTDPNTGQKVEINLHEIPDDAIVRLKRNGEIVTVSGKEAKADAMRASKFTFEMQKLRQREEEFAGKLSDAEKLEQVLTDDNLLGEYIVQTRPQLVTALAQRLGITRAEATAALASEVQQQAAQAPASSLPANFNPSELANLGEVSSLFDQRAQTLEQKVLEQLGTKLGEVNTSVAEMVRAEVEKGVQTQLREIQRVNRISAFDVEITKTLDGIKTANPALKSIPGIDAILRVEAFKMKPQSPEEMLDAISTVAQGIVEGLDETYNAARKATVIDKATMEKTGIEPPAGAPASTMNRPISYAGPDGKVDFKNIRQAARAALGVG